MKRARTVLIQIRARREAGKAFSRPGSLPVLVYQMGKVGSSTVYASLRARAFPNPVFHVHYLSDDLPVHRREHEIAGVIPAPYHIFLGEALHRECSRHDNSPLKVISLVRDPIAIVVSALFENTYFNRQLLVPGTDSIDCRKAIDHLTEYFSSPDCLRYIDEWFDRELKVVFGIDVFKEPFPRDDGYAIYSKGSVSALVIRLEDLSELGPKVIADFLGLDSPLELLRANDRTTVREAETYRQVVAGIRLDRDICSRIYSSRFVTHFYSDTMINRFLYRWSRDSDS